MKNKGLIFSIIALAWPTILEQAMQSAVSYVDYAMVGKVGTEAIAAVGVTSTVTWLVNSPLWALGTGFLACVAINVGAGEREKVRANSAQAVSVSLILGLIMTVITVGLSPFVPGWMNAEETIAGTAGMYFAIICAPMVFRSLLAVIGGVMRGAGDTRTPMIVNVGVNITNVILNYFLIYEPHEVNVFGARFNVWGAGLEVIGAAIGTAVAFTLGGAALTLLLYRHKDVSPRGLSLRPDMTVLKPCFRIALPNVFQSLIVMTGQTLFASMVNSLGTVAVTAHSTALTAESAFYIPGYGMKAAASALMGQAYGAKDARRMKSLGRLFLIIEILLMCITGTTLFLAAGSIMKLFSNDAKVIELGTTVLKMVAVSEPVYGVAIILEGMFFGVGDTLYPSIYEAACMWGVRIIGTFVTVKLMGMDLPAAWGCMIAHNTALAMCMIYRYTRGRWNPLNAPKSAKSARTV